MKFRNYLSCWNWLIYSAIAIMGWLIYIRSPYAVAFALAGVFLIASAVTFVLAFRRFYRELERLFGMAVFSLASYYFVLPMMPGGDDNLLVIPVAIVVGLVIYELAGWIGKYAHKKHEMLAALSIGISVSVLFAEQFFVKDSNIMTFILQSKDSNLVFDFVKSIAAYLKNGPKHEMQMAYGLTIGLLPIYFSVLFKTLGESND